VTTDLALADVLATAELSRRRARPPNYKVEAQVMAILAQAMADRPEQILQVLVESAVELLGGGTCGISLLEPQGGAGVFRWVALAGVLSQHAGGCTPRGFSPCGVTLDEDAPQLFIRPGRYFQYFQPVKPEILEGLVIPFYHRDESFGTIWIVTHDPARHFDAEDVRVMSRLGAFTAAGLEAQRSLAAAENARKDSAFMLDLGHRIGLVSDPDQIMRETCAAVGQRLAADRCFFLEPDSSVVRHGWTRAAGGGAESPESGALELWPEAAARPFAIADLAAHASAAKSLAWLKKGGARSCATAPYLHAGQLKVVLGVTSDRIRDWTAEELSLLANAAAWIWPLVSRARTETVLLDANCRLERQVAGQSSA
jgi:GAF domain-containing protein